MDEKKTFFPKINQETKTKGNNMENILTYIKGWLSSIIEIGVALVSISILAEVLFGAGALFGADVINNVTSIVKGIGGENGLVGLVALFVLVALLKKN